MVKVHSTTTDSATAWRVRDALAAHPLLGGATAQITVVATQHGVSLHGWAHDAAIEELATRLALRAAGCRPVSLSLNSSRFPQCKN